MVKIVFIFFCFFFIESSSIWATSLQPIAAQSIEVNVIPIQTFSVTNDKIISFSPLRRGFTVTPFFGVKESREKTFGKFLDGQKVLIKDKKKDFLAHFGFLIADDKAFLFDGVSLNVALFSLKEQRIWRFGDIVYDVIQPPADSGGNATSGETAALRSSFKREIQRQESRKLISARKVPLSMRADPSKYFDEYLVQTTLKSAPFVTMHCHKEDIVNCIVKRKCAVPGVKGGTRGIAFHEKHKMLYLGAKHKIHAFKYQSCHSVARRRTFSIAKSLPVITDLAVDSGSRLWVGLQAKDDRTHGSIFVWKPDQWP